MEVFGGLLGLAGILVFAVGLISVVVPLRMVGLSTRARGSVAVLAGFAVLMLGGSLLRPIDSGTGADSDTSPSVPIAAVPRASVDEFDRRLASSATCAELFEIRNKLDPKSPRIESMNQSLRGIQCFFASSTRDATPEARGAFTVKEYRIYRAVIDTPMSVPEAQAFDAVAKVHGISAAGAKSAVEKVQAILSENKWFASPDSEIRRAVDWTQQ